MQVITEPGAEEALHSQWEGKLVFAKGVDSIAMAITHYIGNEKARIARQNLCWKFARKRYSLPPYLEDVM